MFVDYETIVVGAGAAGMNCCLELQKNDRKYLLISPNIGGRICNDEERHMNYGAVFYFGTYKYMLQSGLLIPGPDVLPSLSQACCHHDNGRGQYPPISATTVKDAPSLLKYMKWMRTEFIPRYSAFKDNCTVMEVRDALEKDPLIKELYQESAQDMIDRMGFGPICYDLISMFAHACTGTRIKDLTALDYLNAVQPLTMQIPPMKLLFDLKRFDFDSEGTKQRLASGSGEVLIDEVVSVAKTADGWQVATGDKTFTCTYLVMAAPAIDAQRLLAPVPEVEDFEVRGASQLTGYLVRGKVKGTYRQHTVHLFDDTIPIIYIAKRFDGDYEVFTEVDFEANRRFDLYFDEWEVLGKKYWSHALYTQAAPAVPQNLAPGLVMAGDLNGLGMEPACISGIYAANKIMGRTVD